MRPGIGGGAAGVFLLAALTAAAAGQVPGISPGTAVEYGRETVRVRQRAECPDRKVRDRELPVTRHPTSLRSIRRSGQRLLQELPVPGPVVDQGDDRLVQARMLTYGWQEYEEKRFGRARDFFARARTGPDAGLSRQAALGQLYTLLRLGDHVEAWNLFLFLFPGNNKSDPDLVESLAGLLFERREWGKLDQLLNRMPVTEKHRWQVLVEEQQIRVAAGKCLAAGDVEAAQRLLDEYRVLLDGCRSVETFFRLVRLVARERPETGVRMFARLGRCRPGDHRWQERITRERLALLGTDALLAMARDKDLSEPPWLRRVLADILWQRLGTVTRESRERGRLIQALFRVRPDDPRVMEVYGWFLLEKGKDSDARRLFSRLFDLRGRARDLEGLVIALERLGRSREAFELLRTHPDLTGNGLDRLRHDLHVQMAADLYAENHYRQAQIHLQKALDLEPEDEGALGLLRWVRFKQGEVRPLLEHLRRGAVRGSREDARLLVDLLDRTAPEYREDLLADLARSADPGIRLLAAERFFARGEVIRAASLDSGDGPWSGCDRPEFGVMSWYDERSGEPGTSDLTTSALLLEQRLPIDRSREVFFMAWPMRLDSGSLPETVLVGTQGLFTSDRSGSWQDRATLMGWSLGMRRQGTDGWSLALGTTPLGGPLAPVLVGEITLHGRSWSLSLARTPVRESLLSWIGQTDPYSQKSWGRVVENQIVIKKNFTSENSFLSVEAQASLLRGHQVENNWSLTGNTSIGKTISYAGAHLSYGGFVFARTFGRNSDFFTYGHGGYYSPELQVVSGPFLQVRTREKSPWFLEGHLSLGYDIRKTADAPRFVELENDPIPFPDDPAAADYRGGREEGLGVQARLRGLLPLGQGWFAGGEGGLSTVGAYTRWHLGLLIRYRFGEGMGLGRPGERMDRMTAVLR